MLLPRFRIGLSYLALSMLAVGLASASAAVAEPHVVVTSKPIHSIVASVLGDVAKPVLLIDEAGASPHTYALRPSDAAAVHSADVFFRVSPALEPFTIKLVRALPTSVKVVTLAEAPGLKLLLRRTGRTFQKDAHGHDVHVGKEFHGDRSDTHHHDRAAVDPHVWLDPENTKAMTAAVLKSLMELVPERAEQLKANALAFSDRIDRLSAKLDGQLAGVRKRPFLAFHDAYQYFEQRFGLAAAGAVTLSPEAQPSARRLTELRRLVTSEGVVCVFTEPGLQHRVAASITEGSGVRIAQLDPEGALIAPGQGLYFELMARLADTFKSCLGNSA
ncbi:MAG: zinc ABC transporter substrate-binding protein [Hyphomicrobiaceae bacterium]